MLKKKKRSNEDNDKNKKRMKQKKNIQQIQKFVLWHTCGDIKKEKNIENQSQ